MTTLLYKFNNIISAENLSVVTRLLVLGVAWFIGTLVSCVLTVAGTFISGWLIALGIIIFVLWTIFCIVLMVGFLESET